MKEVRVKKSELLDILRTNGQKHVQEYQEAIEGWRVETLKELSKLSRKVKKLDLENAVDLTENDFPNLWVSAAQDRPTCHAKDYDRAIAMLDMSTEDEVVISAREFDQFVNDEWDWKEAFTVSNAKYGGSARR